MESVKIIENQRKLINESAELTLEKQGFVIIPYYNTGYLNITNLGFNKNNVNIKDYATFKRVFTGNDTISLQWKDSMSFQYSGSGNPKISYKMGEYIIGNLEMDNSETIIATDESFNQYKSMEVKNIMTFRIPAKYELNENYNVLFYKIPEISNHIVYRVSSIEKDWVNNKLIGYILTLESINQELSNTGMAKQQNIMLTSPGQGQLDAKVYKRKDFNITPNLIEGRDYILLPGDRVLSADKTMYKHRPIKKFVFKHFGNGVLNTLAFTGRPVKVGDSLEKFETPRLLFGYDFENTRTPNLFNSQQNETNYYFGNFEPCLEYYKEFMDGLKSFLFKQNSKYEYTGFLRYDINQVKATNPISYGAYEYNLFGKYDQINNTVIPWRFSLPHDEQPLNTGNITGCYIEYYIGQEKNIHDRFFDNYFLSKNMAVLPLNKYSGFSYSNGLFGLVKLMGLIIGGSNIFQTGITKNKNNYDHFSRFYGIVSAPFIDLNNGLFSNTIQNNKHKIPFDMFINDSPASVFFSNKTINISYTAKLTDLFYLTEHSNKIVSTLNIGQTKDEKGNNIYSNGKPLLLNGRTHLTASQCDGYIVDAIQVCGVLNGYFSIELLDANDDIVFSGVYMTSGLWSDSPREIWTEIIVSPYNRENIFFNKPLPYPKELPPPRPPIGILDIIETGYYNFAGGDSFDNKQWEFLKFLNHPYIVDNKINKDKLLDQTTFKTIIFTYNEKIQSFSEFKKFYKTIEFAFKFSINYRMGAAIDNFGATGFKDIDLDVNKYIFLNVNIDNYILNRPYYYNLEQFEPLKYTRGSSKGQIVTYLQNTYKDIMVQFIEKDGTLYLITEYTINPNLKGDWMTFNNIGAKEGCFYYLNCDTQIVLKPN